MASLSEGGSGSYRGPGKRVESFRTRHAPSGDEATRLTRGYARAFTGLQYYAAVPPAGVGAGAAFSDECPL